MAPGNGPEKILGVEVTRPKESANKWTREQFESAMTQLRDITSNASLAGKLAAIDQATTIKDIILVQLALTKLGYQPGTVDGLRSRRNGEPSQTSQAIMEFQGANNLTPDGIVGTNTLSGLVRALLAGRQETASAVMPDNVTGQGTETASGETSTRIDFDDLPARAERMPSTAPVRMPEEDVNAILRSNGIQVESDTNVVRTTETTRLVEETGTIYFNGKPFKSGDTVSMQMLVDGRSIGVIGEFGMKRVETNRSDGSGTISTIYELRDVRTVVGQNPVSDRVDISDINSHELTNLSAHPAEPAPEAATPSETEALKSRRRGTELFDRYQFPDGNPLSPSERKELARFAYEDAQHLAAVRSNLPIDSRVLAAQLDPETYRTKVTQIILTGYDEGLAYSHMVLPYLLKVGHSQETAERLVMSTVERAASHLASSGEWHFAEMQLVRSIMPTLAKGNRTDLINQLKTLADTKISSASDRSYTLSEITRLTIYGKGLITEPDKPYDSDTRSGGITKFDAMIDGKPHVILYLNDYLIWEIPATEYRSEMYEQFRQHPTRKISLQDGEVDLRGLYPPEEPTGR